MLWPSLSVVNPSCSLSPNLCLYKSSLSLKVGIKYYLLIRSYYLIANSVYWLLLLRLEYCVFLKVMFWDLNFQSHDEPWVGLVHEVISFIIGITAPIREALAKVVEPLILGQKREAPFIEVSGFPWISHWICCLNHRPPSLRVCEIKVSVAL